ncbi:hypothetical protein BDV59DRAFT_120673 [Aspergillus ambiguus]|uniref:uncharacterized protein n=1 Tax=Aspergillus ambiguus TaxID=176160 RepID=UPI003CCCFB8D
MAYLMCLFYTSLVLCGMALGSQVSPSFKDTPQYLVDVSHRADGQLQFTPSSLTSVPLGAIILFVAPANLPFDLYQTPYDPPQDMCVSRKKVNRVPDTSHVSVVTQASVAHFACSAVLSACVCDGASLFMVNPAPGIARSVVKTHSVCTTTSSSAGSRPTEGSRTDPTASLSPSEIPTTSTVSRTSSPSMVESAASVRGCE